MLDTQTQARFTKSCTDAATGYATAGIAAYGVMAAQALDFWAQMLSAMAPPPEPPAPRSWYREPAPLTSTTSPRRAQRRAAALPALMPLTPVSAVGSPIPAWGIFNPWDGRTAANAVPTPMSLFSAWLSMFPLRGPPTAWPMAFVMIAAGVPQQVAWPTAEANAAAMEAAETATKTMNQIFSSYRSDGGHAVAQLAVPHKLMLAAMIGPVGTGLLLPWLMTTSSSLV